MATATRARRKRRLRSRLVPRRVRRFAGRWRRRWRKARAVVRRARRAVPAQRRGEGVLCGACRQRVPQAELSEHLRLKCRKPSRQRKPAARRGRGVARPPRAQAPAEQSSERQRPEPKQAASRAVGWWGLAAALGAVVPVFGGGPLWVVASVTCLGVGAVVYAAERRHGSTHDRGGVAQSRAQARGAARAAGCSAACMWSPKPVSSCRCPCGGSTHGSQVGRSRRAA